MILEDGAGEAVQKLYKNEAAWNYVLKKIASGERRWLYVAVRLREGTDGGLTSMLETAVGEALGRQPANVLSIVLPTFQIQDVCGNVDIDDEQFGTYELALAEIKRQIHLVSEIETPTLEAAKNSCLEELEASKVHIKSFFENSQNRENRVNS